jgi:hypothetical protein
MAAEIDSYQMHSVSSIDINAHIPSLEQSSKPPIGHESLDQISGEFFSNDILKTIDFQSPAMINLSIDQLQTPQSIMQTNHAKDDEVGDNNRVVAVTKLGNTHMNRKIDDKPLQEAMVEDAYQSGLTQDKNDHHHSNKDDDHFNKDDDHRPASKVDVRSNDVVGFSNRRIKNVNDNSYGMPNQQSESESSSVSSQQLVFPDTLHTTTTKPTPTVMKYILIALACMPMFAQDLCIYLTSTCIVAGYIQLHIELYHLSKLLVIAPTALVAIVIYFIIQSSKSQDAMKISQLLSSIDKNDDAKKPLNEGSSQAMSDERRNKQQLSEPLDNNQTFYRSTKSRTESTNLLTAGIGGRDDRRASASHISIRLKAINKSSSAAAAAADDDDDDDDDGYRRSENDHKRAPSSADEVGIGTYYNRSLIYQLSSSESDTSGVDAKSDDAVMSENDDARWDYDISRYYDDTEAQLDTRRIQFAMNPTAALYRLSSSGSSSSSGSRESEVDNHRMLDVGINSNRWGNRADYGRNGGFETMILQDIDHDHHPPSSYHHHHYHNHNDHEGFKKSIVGTSSLYVLSSSESESESHRDD